jgi:hypothetical protein
MSKRSPEPSSAPWRGGIKKGIIRGAFFVACSLAFSQQTFIEQSLVINVEVPVRVYDGNVFVDTLGKDDFEVLEDGVPQKIEAVYLIKKAAIERRDEGKRYLPDTARRLYLFFELTDYVPKMAEAVQDFVQNILAPDDTLMVVTPLKTYQMKEEALALKPREAIAAELLKLIEKDTQAGNSEFRSTVADLTDLTKEMSAAMRGGDLEKPAPAALPELIEQRAESAFVDLIIRYSALLDRLDTLRQIDQTKLADFARLLKKEEGQKSIFLFYQREHIPQIDPKMISEFMSRFQENNYVYQTLTSVSKFRERQNSFDVEKVKQLYSDSSASIHFLFLTTPRENVEGVYFEEWSGDVFASFREMAEATGGFFDSSSNPVPMFHNALQAAENYCYFIILLEKSKKKRHFRKIEVRVKKRGLSRPPSQQLLYQLTGSRMALWASPASRLLRANSESAQERITAGTWVKSGR